MPKKKREQSRKQSRKHKRKRKQDTPQLLLIFCIGFALFLMWGMQTTEGQKFLGIHGPLPDPPPPHVDANLTTIRIAAWNLQVFGQDKASNATLMASYAGIMKKYDIIVVQEIRDASGTAFPKLCSLMPGYGCNVSERTGRTSSKEQYGIIYKNAELVKTTDLHELQEEFERPPFLATFKSGNWTFTLAALHAKPEDAGAEIANLEGQLLAASGDLVVLGDLNADCSYYDRSRDPTFISWAWAVPDDADTTVSPGSCAYDRIIYNSGADANYLSYGIDKSSNAWLSDHYLVYGLFRVDRA